MIQCVLVYRTGGAYTLEYVKRLVDGLQDNWPGGNISVLTDSEAVTDVAPAIPLKYHWPGWWSKMELFRPDVFPDDPIFYLDLDTVIVRRLYDIHAGLEHQTQSMMLRDFYKPERMASGVMFLTPPTRRAVWAAWDSPADLMKRHQRGGDQEFLRASGALDGCEFFQDRWPGQFVSYKVHVREAVKRGRDVGDGTIPPAASIICFHGQPRPFTVDWLDGLRR